MTIAPDTKDWTWVTSKVCTQCGFDPSQISLAQLPGQIRQQVNLWDEVLAGPVAKQRPDSATWSPLEYGAHVRDVLKVMHERLDLMLAQDNPDLPSWDQDQAARAGRYDQLSPALVADEIDIEAQMLANEYKQVTDAQAQRPGRRSDGSEFTIFTLGLYLLHDLVHHAWDVSAPTELVSPLG